MFFCVFLPPAVFSPLPSAGVFQGAIIPQSPLLQALFSPGSPANGRRILSNHIVVTAGAPPIHLPFRHTALPPAGNFFPPPVIIANGLRVKQCSPALICLFRYPFAPLHPDRRSCCLFGTGGGIVPLFLAATFCNRLHFLHFHVFYTIRY